MAEDLGCPHCKYPCRCVAISASRGEVMKCNRCIISIHDDTKQPLLWYFESSRLWESLDDPEGEERPHQVKVIWAQKVQNIDYHPDFLAPP